MQTNTPALVVLLAVAASCTEPERLTRAAASEFVRDSFFREEPAYAEVPQRVVWSESSPTDDFDGRSIQTLERLKEMGLVTLEREGSPSDGSVTAHTTPAAARVLGLVPSARGPALRGRVATKMLDGVGSVDVHPGDPRTGRVEVIWHYASPTPLHAVFAPVSDRPLGEPQATVLSMRWSEGAWRAAVIIPRTRPASRDD